MNNLKNKSIILFDGVCILCNNLVEFIIKHDKKEQFLFASLQSDVAKEILLQFDLKKIDADSIILVENEKLYVKSTATLKIAKNLNGFIKIAYVGILIPSFFRDIVYHYIAKNRYKWFGKKDQCFVMNDCNKKRFIDIN